jgi:hypothetical protein
MNKLDIFEILQPFVVSLVFTNPIRDIRPQVISLSLLCNLNFLHDLLNRVFRLFSLLPPFFTGRSQASIDSYPVPVFALVSLSIYKYVK